MPTPKFVDGRITYMMRTFDGSYFQGTMSEAEAKIMLSKAKEDASVPGFELVNGPYLFETEQVEVKLTSKKKKDILDEI